MRCLERPMTAAVESLLGLRAVNGRIAPAFSRSRAVRLAGIAVLLTGLVAIAEAPSSAAGEFVEIGTTVTTRNRVTGSLGEEKRRLQNGLRVHHDEILETSRNGHAELKLDDDTKLVLGPEAQLILDEYVVNTKTSKALISLKYLKGAFRFITGRNDSKAYVITTPTATLGVRGTVFDTFVGEDGTTAILLHEGAVQVCSRSATCRLHDAVGLIMAAGLNDIVSLPVKWTAGLVSGASVASAFPFIGQRLAIDPIRRLTYAGIVGPGVSVPQQLRRTLHQGDRTLRQGGKTIEQSIRRISPF